MITQIKKWGNSYVIVLPTEFMDFHKFTENDWIDISDINKVNKQEVKK